MADEVAVRKWRKVRVNGCVVKVLKECSSPRMCRLRDLVSVAEAEHIRCARLCGYVCVVRVRVYNVYVEK